MFDRLCEDFFSRVVEKGEVKELEKGWGGGRLKPKNKNMLKGGKKKGKHPLSFLPVRPPLWREAEQGGDSGTATDHWQNFNSVLIIYLPLWGKVCQHIMHSHALCLCLHLKCMCLCMWRCMRHQHLIVLKFLIDRWYRAAPSQQQLHSHSGEVTVCESYFTEGKKWRGPGRLPAVESSNRL